MFQSIDVLWFEGFLPETLSSYNKFRKILIFIIRVYQIQLVENLVNGRYFSV